VGSVERTIVRRETVDDGWVGQSHRLGHVRPALASLSLKEMVNSFWTWSDMFQLFWQFDFHKEEVSNPQEGLSENWVPLTVWSSPLSLLKWPIEG
jgi:hypothetical protein